MTNRIFSGDHWTDQELLDLLKALETMYAQGTRLAMYKDQQLQFASGKELLQRISDLRAELEARDALAGVTPAIPKKQVRITTRNKGFRRGTKI